LLDPRGQRRLSVVQNTPLTHAECAPVAEIDEAFADILMGDQYSSHRAAIRASRPRKTEPYAPCCLAD
jgi:hypothetical protein